MTAVLAYHKVDDRFELGLTNVRPKRFEKQVAAIERQGYTIVCNLQPDVSRKSVCLTFDDGYDCFYRNVVPVLNARGARATVFVITDFIGQTNDWDIRLSYKPFRHMDAKQIEEVSRLGFVVGSHSCSHRDLTRLDDDSLKRELMESKKILEDMTDREVESFSFPFGRYDRRTAEAAFAAGYRKIYGMGSASAEGVIPRTPVYRIDSSSAVLRKLNFERLEIAKSDFIHSFANISALLSVRESRNRASGNGRNSFRRRKKTQN